MKLSKQIRIQKEIILTFQIIFVKKTEDKNKKTIEKWKAETT